MNGRSITMRANWRWNGWLESIEWLLKLYNQWG
jgi:hypothetical protein